MDNDYGKVIDALDYSQGLAEHPDIPQSDAGIMRIICEQAKKGVEKFNVLDLGCGPGRLTQPIAQELEKYNRVAEVVGLDVSEDFISFARQYRAHPNASYLQVDFLNHEFGERRFDVVLMQGLFHHVPLEKRGEWLARCKDLLSEKGRIIIGDEFVPDYISEEDRVLNVVGLYAYVIASALRANHQSLADIESKNMVDDISAGLPGAGHSNPALIAYIQQRSTEIYEATFQGGVQDLAFKPLLRTVADYIREQSAKIAETDTQNHDRGDYKISIEKQQQDLELLGLKLVDIKKYGPTDWLGGMAVIVFVKV